MKYRMMYGMPLQKIFLKDQLIEKKQEKHVVLLQRVLIFILLSIALLACSSSKNNAASIDSDNTAKNSRDLEGGPLTPESQSNNEVDLKLTQQIRAELIKSDAFSLYGQNIKIITINGIVTLRGPVNSQNEKNLIYSKSQNIAGNDKVINQLDVVSSE